MHLLFVNCDCHYDSTNLRTTTNNENSEPQPLGLGMDVFIVSTQRRMWDLSDPDNGDISGRVVLTTLLIGLSIDPPEEEEVGQIMMGTSRGMSSRQTHNALDNNMLVG